MAQNKQTKLSLKHLVVDQDLCIGCGICAVVDSSIRMKHNEYGFLVPQIQSLEEQKNKDLLRVCPFNPYPENEVRTENELAREFLKDAPQIHEKIGQYYNTYVGYSHKFRLTSSSGGIATYILSELLAKGHITHVVSVKASNEGDSHYEYAISSTQEELLESSKTKYYPVTLSDALSKVKHLDGKVAVVGVGCFVKAVRLLQHYDSFWKDKIYFIVGIICGGIKSSFFADYLASKATVDCKTYKEPQFRIKDYDSTASDYSYGCIDKDGNEKRIKMRSVGDMWGTGLFKNNACDFCDDVTTELADISLGDAWLDPFVKDGKGTSVIVTRSKLADKLIQDGLTQEELHIEELSAGRLASSQQGSFNHRHKGLKYRIRKVAVLGIIIPPKRFATEDIPIDFKFVQKQRQVVRKKSLVIWQQTQNAKDFDLSLSKELEKLRLLTRIHHYLRAIKRKVKHYLHL